MLSVRSTFRHGRYELYGRYVISDRLFNMETANDLIIAIVLDAILEI